MNAALTAPFPTIRHPGAGRDPRQPKNAGVYGKYESVATDFSYCSYYGGCAMDPGLRRDDSDRRRVMQNIHGVLEMIAEAADPQLTSPLQGEEIVSAGVAQ
jgi:hypothetical protein